MLKYLRNRRTKLIWKSSTAFNVHRVLSSQQQFIHNICTVLSRQAPSWPLRVCGRARRAVKFKIISGCTRMQKYSRCRKKRWRAQKHTSVIKRSNKPSRTEQVVHGRGCFASVCSLFAAAAQNYAFLYFILLKMEAALSIFSSAQAMTSVFTHSLLRSPSTSITEHVPLQPALMGSSPCPLSVEISFREMCLAILPCQYSHTNMDVSIHLTTLVLMAFLYIFDRKHHAWTVKNNKSRLVIVGVWVVVGYKYSACRFKGLPLWRRWIYFGSVELG